ncbi:MAG: hypothetical protein ACI849_000826 [Patiriisocius sp.]|jgi:hypothetical protein
MKTKQILRAMKVISWVVFIGLCIKVGTIIIASTLSFFVQENTAQNLYRGLDLSQLYGYSKQYYLYIISFLITIGLLKAYLFYLVIKIFQKIDFEQPFTVEVSNIISKISYYAVVAAVIGVVAKSYSKWIVKKGISFQIDWGSNEFLFMAGIIFIVGLIIKRGIELQVENDLTI